MINQIADILVRRDGISKQEALDLINETRAEIIEAVNNGDYFYAEDIMTCNLGLEPDYLFYLF